jgi:hypothetical protein
MTVINIASLNSKLINIVNKIEDYDDELINIKKEEKI